MYQFNNETQKRAGKTKRLMTITMSVFLIMIGNYPLFGKTLEIAVDVWHPYENISDQQAPGFSTEVITNVFQSM
ncbi:MAG: hypothetical protein KAR43_03115, partial [Deltaproteobacteria bacterium]|nr:hypothetical protein [Deltaproteobacteria bacterium]